MRGLFKKHNKESHDFWISYTDLMAGLLLILMVASLTGSRTSPKPYELDDSDLMFLNEKFKDVFENDLYVELIQAENSIRIYPDTTKCKFLFAPDEDTLALDNNLRVRLRKFGKKFIQRADTLVKSGKINIQEIRIEGHTDSDNSFIYNMRLSSNRAHSVYSFIHDSCGLNSDQQRFMEQKIVAVGYSESQLLNSKGELINSQKLEDENKDKSRRIEFRIIGKSQNTNQGRISK